MADAMKAAGQHADQPATGELVDRERHHLGALMSFGAIVLPRKSYTRVIQRDETFVRC